MEAPMRLDELKWEGGIDRDQSCANVGGYHLCRHRAPTGDTYDIFTTDTWAALYRYLDTITTQSVLYELLKE
jgi:hypothetical protein